MSASVLFALVLVSIVLMVVLTSKLKFNVFLSMFLISLGLGVAALPAKDVVPVLTEGFGGTMRSIGVIILLGTMIGLLLERTGATVSLASAILRATGERRAGLCIGATGFVTGIPIFCDSGFIVLSGLNRSLVQRSRKPMIYLATLLAVGLYSVHCLIPPHPGAMAAAGLAGADVGRLIVFGLLVAVPTAAAGFAWARFMCRGLPEGAAEAPRDAPAWGARDLPSPLRSALPIAVPLALLAAKSAFMLRQPAPSGALAGALKLLGCPEVALLIGVGLAVSLLKGVRFRELNELFDRAIEKAGPILVLTGAGGIFGAVIKATGAGAQAGELLAGTGLGLFIPFVVAALLKTAQGSSTVAIMTAASMLAPMLAALHLDSDAGRLLATLAMGAGSMAVSHANDSYFWVITKFSGLDPAATLRVYTTATLVMGLTAFLMVLLGAAWVL